MSVIFHTNAGAPALAGDMLLSIPGRVWLFFVVVDGPKRFLRAARQELLDPSKLWWGRLADRRRCSFSVSLGVIPLVFARFVEVPVRVEVAAGS